MISITPKNGAGARLRRGAFVVAMALALPAAAQADQHNPITRLSTSVDSFTQTFAAGDYGSMIEKLPPRLLQAVMDQTGQTRAAAISLLTAQTVETMQGITVISIDMAVDDDVLASTSTGFNYALIPTVTVLETADGTKVRTGSTTLGLEEGGSWYLSRVASDQQEKAMKFLYPEIANVTFPQGSQEVID